MAQDPEQNWGRFFGMGLEIAVGVGLGVAVGWWLDKRYGWEPWGTAIGAFVGLSGGVYLLVRDAIRMNKR